MTRFLPVLFHARNPAWAMRAAPARDRVPGLASPGDATAPLLRQNFTVWSFGSAGAAKSTVGKILPFPN